MGINKGTRGGAMDKSIFKAGFFHNEGKAYQALEAVRWPNGPVCPRTDCKSLKVYRLNPGKSGRRVLKCGQCRKQFSVTVGTIFEDSHLPLSCWLAAIHLMSASKKSMSAHQLHRMLGITYKSAWFMAHRIRYAMTDLSASGGGSLLDGIVEADETYIGGKSEGRGNKDNKIPVVSLVERRGRVRSFPMLHVTAGNLKKVLRENIAPTAQLMTDQFSGYTGLQKHFASHDTVNHSAKEYVRGKAHTNTVEGYFSLLKRGITGTFHHVSSQHLHRYLAEFDFRYNARKTEDKVRSVLAVQGIEGKRLQYRDPRRGRQAWTQA